ncbi:decaprenyl-phosphate phosphoribosyltransferase [Nocardioides sp. CFH 31398]|uniref:decaprenyl-phosphate phosphoribosyltransferase n=1 Tax=Nocardioides sp. CFH 31398 TaxID=2919579 RepID=UPI001F05A441|nr:decaprenyl-phosphate phosphoribosyltransferase [Nocardioides sp. CFH 31398]MCH1868803.1 decaprenyl-phosphate phosphoribosyltransferase [Nocardioides sp. CFH 31398]
MASAQQPAPRRTRPVVAQEPGPATRRAARRGWPLLRAVRPRQWTKNVLVLVVPAAAGELTRPQVLGASAVALASFCLAAGAVYLLNDVRDAPHDRRHPRKRHRPVAAGELGPRTAVVAGVLLAVAALGLAAWWSLALGAVVAAYFAVQAAYTAGLKDQPVLDLAIVSSGFVLRVMAGGAATEIPISGSLLLVASFGSLFMVSGKRFSEVGALGEAGETRASMKAYSQSYLRFVWSMAAAVTVVTYVQWAFEDAGGRPGDVSWGVISVAPLVLGMLRYAVDIDRGNAGAPEDLVLGDRVLQVLAVLWLATVVPAVAGA